jgi:hypothetical protein
MEKRFGVLVIFLSLVLFISSCDYVVKDSQLSPDVPFVVTDVVLEDRWCGTGETEYCDHGEHYQIVLSYDTTGGHTGDYLTFYFTLSNDDGCEIFSHDGFMIDFHSYGTDGFRDQVAYHDCAFGERIFISEAYLKDGADGEIVQVLTPDQLNGEFLLGVPGYRCGNDICEMYGGGSFGEHCLNCPLDCGSCDGADFCGDDVCGSEEDCESCPFDCGDCDVEETDCFDDCSIQGCEGQACSDYGEICVAGVCELVCGDDEIQCGGECIDSNTDEENCGACNIPCSPGVLCVEGDCLVIEDILCSDDCTAEGCEGELCDVGGQICTAGFCSCPNDFFECNGACVDVNIDVNHCGGCGIPCSDDESCEGGICISDVIIEEGCGSGPACAEDEICVAGACMVAEELYCYNNCNAEGCEGEICDVGGEICVAGICELVCDDGFAICNNECVDINIDENHCGGCGIPCSAGESCEEGICGSNGAPLPGCVLDNAFWEFDENDDEFNEGQSVTLSVKGSPACLGKTLSFEVFEDDGIWGDDPVGTNPLNVNFAFGDEEEIGWNEVYTGVEENLLGVWGTSADNVYIVSGIDDGRITHYDGKSWEDVGLNVNLPSIRGIWGSSADNIYVVGRAFIEDTNPDPMIWNGVFRQEGIYHFDGTSWEEEDMLDFKYPLDEIWGSSANDIYVTATQDKTVFHYDGNSWELVEMGATNNRFKSIWGSSANDVYLGGLHSTNPTGGNPTSSIFHYDGNSWEEVVRNGNWNYFKDMWGSSSDNVYAVGPGNAGKVLHYDGVSWEEEVVDPNMPGNKYFMGVWGSSANDVYVVGKPGSNSELYSNVYHYDGISWERVYTGTDYSLIDIWGSSSEDIYSIGWDGKILHYGITPYIIAEGSWLAETQRDMFGSPEYYFMANLFSDYGMQSVDLLREE